MQITKFVAAVAVIALARVASAGYVAIGSWNIEHCGQREGQDPAAIAEQIRLCGVDVLALQEIHDTDDDPAVIASAKLTKVCELLREHTGATWKYVLHPERAGVDRNQHVGVAWNADRVEMVGSPYAVGVEYANAETWKRTPHAAMFRTKDGKADFVVISLHMKSNVPVDGLPEPAEIRRLEAEALAAKLADLRSHFGSEQDFVLIGDTNCKRADEPALAIYSKAGFADLNAGDATTYWSEYQGKESTPPFDRILVPKDQPEFRWSRQYVLTPAARKDHDARLSDHWPVVATFSSDADDDS